MTREEAVNLFNELSGVVGYTPIPEAVKQGVRRLYRYVTGEPLKHCNCPDLYSDAIIVIQLKLKAMEDKKQQSYKLKRGVVIQLQDTTDVYTRDNLTDDVAREYLEKYPNKANLFDAIPEGQPEVEEQPELEEQPEVENEPEEQPEDKPKEKSKKRK